MFQYGCLIDGLSLYYRPWSADDIRLLKMRSDAHDSYPLTTRRLCIFLQLKYPSLAAADINRVFVRCVCR